MSDGAVPGEDLPVDEDDLVTVGELNASIADLVEDEFALDGTYVVGEVSDHYPGEPHAYFDLTGDGSSIRCAIFNAAQQRLSADLENGVQVAVDGELSFWEAQGSCTLVVFDVFELGEGEHSKRYEENRAALAEAGYLDEERKRPLPELPGAVGIVTSADSDARTDAVTAIHGRYPDVDIRVYDARVQGDTALVDLVNGITQFETDPAVELVVLTRGGGADATLRVFDELPLCRVIAETKTPVVVAVGHENDRVLAGEVADRRVMTPTHVGEVIPDRDALKREVTTLSRSLGTAYQSAVESELGVHALALDSAYEATVESRLQEVAGELDFAYEGRIERRLSGYRERLERAFSDLKQAKVHEKELAETVESVRAAEARRQRLYKIALVVLVLMVLGLLGLVVFDVL